MAEKCQDCSIAGCGKPRVARGLCMTHYQRLRRRGDAMPPTLPRTFNGDPVEAGRKGGLATAQNAGPDGMRQRGILGGAATYQKMGHEHYRRIGAIGGKKGGRGRA